MKRKRFKEEQIIRFLKEVEKGISVKELCQQYDFSEQTYNPGKRNGIKPAGSRSGTLINGLCEECINGR